MKRIKNWFLCKKYPFLKLYNIWTGKFSGYHYTWYDVLDDGWKKAFGKQLLNELKQASKSNHNNFRIHDIKEKYGYLHIYLDGYSHGVDHVIQKYELLSICYCRRCGKPVRYVTRGWIEYLCEECFECFTKDNVDIDKNEYRVTELDIPTSYHIINNKKSAINIQQKYNIDFYELWDIKK